jgi:hypothetical protein
MQMIIASRIRFCVTLAFALVSAELFAAEVEMPPAAQRKVSFAEDIQPLFVRYCYDCHSGDKHESSFRLDKKEIAFEGGDFGESPIIVGKSAESPLVRYASGVDEDLVMPPKGARMTAAEIGLLRAWIDQGADWPAGVEGALRLTTDHWSFQPLKPVKVPEVSPDLKSDNPIDAFIAAKLAESKLTLSAPADRTTFIRRIYLDIVGLPPTPEEIAAFHQDDSPDAYSKLIEHLLASPHYGERWARHWLDVVRFAETNGFETNVERPNAYHYRDYVINALNSDLPYDRFVMEQLAGDALGADAATGFLVAGPWDQVKSPDPVLTAMQRSDELADITSTTATTFLGLTVGCARCHNHKFDPILQKDYYALQAVFAGVQHGDRQVKSARSPAEEQLVQAAARKLADVEQQLTALRPPSSSARTLMLDDEMVSAEGAAGVGVRWLVNESGHGENPAGAARGQRQDQGDFDRFPNVSRGRYTWWPNVADQDVIAYQPRLQGRYRLWLSWGCGFDTHAQDAQYVLDRDGDLATKDDQQVIATIDQRQFANGSADKFPAQALWSGFAAAGVYDWKPSSVLLVRGGKTGAALTADIVAWESLPGEVAPNALVETSQPPLKLPVNARHNVERFPPISAKYIRFTALATSSGAEPCLDEIEVFSVAQGTQPARNVALDATLTSSGDYQGNPAHRLQHINDGKYGNSFSWISNTAGAGWVELELPVAVSIDQIDWGRDRNEAYADRTPTKYTIEVAVEPGRYTPVATSADRLPSGMDLLASAPHLPYLGLPTEKVALVKSLIRERDQLQSQLQSLQTQQVVYAGRFVTPPTTHLLYRGDPMLPREEVAPDSLTVISSLNLAMNAPEVERRLALAKWMVDPTNPLTARVMVNRVWQHHFGTGLVDTPSDLGVNGARPSHPELLDWLAQRFMDDGWSLKDLHRLILTSRTYQQANLPQEQGLKIDAQCRLLWRYPPHRLEAESIRDSILFTSGALDLRMGGPGWSTFKPNSNYVRFYDPKEDFGPAEWRRAIYMTKVRMRQDGVFGTFDCPDGGQIAPKRARSTTALQALSLFNSKFTLDQSERLAARVKSEAGATNAAQIQRIFELCFGRTPDADEVAVAEKFVAEHGMPALCRAVFNANEFLFLP